MYAGAHRSFSLTWNLGPLLLTESDGTGILMYTVPMSRPLPQNEYDIVFRIT